MGTEQDRFYKHFNGTKVTDNSYDHFATVNGWIRVAFKNAYSKKLIGFYANMEDAKKAYDLEMLKIECKRD